MSKQTYTFKKKEIDARARINSRQPSFFSITENDDKYKYGFKQFGFNMPQVKPTENLSPIKTAENNWFESTEQRLQNENKKLREELLLIKESYLKEKETLLDKIEKKNNIIFELHDHLNYYDARKLS